MAFPQQASPSKPQRCPGRASQQTPEERALLGRLAVLSRSWQEGTWGLGFLHFCCHFLGLGSSQVAQAGAEHSWHRAEPGLSWAGVWLPKAGTESCPACPWHLPPAPAGPPGGHPSPAAPELWRARKAQQEKFSLWGDGLGAETAAAWRKGSGMGLLFPHYLSQRAGMEENPACPQAAPKDGQIKAMRCHTACPSHPCATAEAAQGLWVLPLPPEQDQPLMKNFGA